MNKRVRDSAIRQIILVDMRRLLTLIIVLLHAVGVAPHLLLAQTIISEPVQQTTEARSEADDQDRALKVWNRYAQCLKDRRFKPCFSLLSRNVLQTWRQQHDVTASAQYADVKGGEEIRYTELQISHVKKEGTKVLITAQTSGDGEGGKFVGQMDFLLVKEDGNWRIDKIVERGTKYLP